MIRGLGLRNVVFTGRDQAEASGGWPHWAVISIAEPDTGLANLKEGWMDVLRLEFDDCDRAEDSYVVFDKAMARQVITFVETMAQNRQCEGILVHCRAGISRSAAVAKWIALQYELPFNRKYSLYNRFVYRVLRREHKLLVG